MVDQTVTIRTVLQDTIARKLSRVNKTFSVTLQGVYRLSAGLGPLNSQFSQLAGILAAGFGAREAIDLAREQVTAERNLLAALNDRAIAQNNLLTIASQLQEVTAIGDEALIPVATLLANMGVSASEIPRGLQAAVDTSAALRIELEAAAKGVGLALTANRAGELGERIPELQRLQAEGRLAAEALDVLEEKFAGAGAAAADTDFGDYQRALNTIGDQAEEIGKIFIQIFLPAIQTVQRSFESLVERLQTASFQALVGALVELTPSLTRLGLVVASVASGLLAFQAATFVFGPLIGIIGSLATAFGAVLGSVTPIGIALVGVVATLRLFPDLLGAFRNIFDGVINRVRDLSSGFREAFGAFSEGRIEFEDLWNFILLQLDTFKNQFEANVSEPISAAVRGIFRTVDGLITFVVNEAKAAVLSFSNFAVRQISAAFTEISIGISNLLAGTALGDLLGINAIPEVVADALRRTVAIAGRDPLGVGEIIKEAERIAGEGASEVFNALGDEAEKLQERRRELNNILAQQEAELTDFVEKAAADRLAKREAAATAEITQEQIKSAEIITSLRSVQSEIAATNASAEGILDNLDAAKVTDLIRNANEASLQVLRSVLDAQVADDFEKRKITAEEFFAIRQAIETTAADQAIRSTQTLLDLENERLIKLKDQFLELNAQRIEQEDFVSKATQLNLSDKERAEAAELLLDLKKQENEQLATITTSNERVLSLVQQLSTAQLQRLQIQQDLNKEQTDYANSLVGTAEEALTRLTEVSTEVNTALESGQITQTQAIQATTAAQNRFNSEINNSIELVRSLIESSPELASAYGQVIERLQKIREEGALLADQPQGGFFTGVVEGARTTALELSNLEKAGQRVGQSLAQNLASGLVDVFINGTKSMKQFLGQFLLTIARMILELIIYRAIATALGFTGPLSAPPVAAALQGGKAGPWGIAKRGTGQPAQGQQGPVQTGRRANWAPAAALMAMLAAAPAAAASSTTKPIHRIHGGSVPGPSVRRDIIPAMLSPKEWVINNAATAYYGDSIMNAINQRWIPKELLMSLQSAKRVNSIMNALGRHNTGGAAGGDAGFTPRDLTATNDSISRAYIVADEGTMQRMLAGGKRAMLEFFSDNSDEIKGMLG